MYLEITGHPYLIFNGIFGMAKGSKFLKFALETIKLNYEQTPDYTARWVPARTGPVFFTSVFVSWSQIGDFLTCRITDTILWSSNKHDWGGISGGEIRQIFHLPGLMFVYSRNIRLILHFQSMDNAWGCCWVAAMRTASRETHETLS